jgi:hypothetical protein
VQSENAVGQAQLEGTGIFGEVEQPNSVTCNDVRLADRSNQTHSAKNAGFRRTGGQAGVAFTEQQ